MTGYTCRLSLTVATHDCAACKFRLPADKGRLAAEIMAWRADGPPCSTEGMATLLPNISHATLSRWESGKVKPNNRERTIELMDLITAREIPGAPDECPLRAKLDEKGG